MSGYLHNALKTITWFISKSCVMCVVLSPIALIWFSEYSDQIVAAFFVVLASGTVVIALFYLVKFLKQDS